MPTIVVHRIGQQLLFEFPRRVLNTDFLMTCQIDTVSAASVAVQTLPCRRTQDGVDTVGAMLEVRNYWHVTQVEKTLQLGLPDSPGLPIRRFGADSAVTVDVTSLLRGGSSGARVIRRIVMQPHGVAIDLAQRVGHSTVILRWRLLQLPNRPTPTGRVAYLPALPVQTQQIWRLEKRDPWAVSSDVVAPITFYLDPHTPRQWIRFIKRGIAEWTPVFDSIGFRHAIRVREVDGPDRERVWASLNDGHHNVVVWQRSRQGLDDAAAGEAFYDTAGSFITSASIRLSSFSVDTMAANDISASAVVFDPLVQQQPLGWDVACPFNCQVPDSLKGLFLQGAAAHEMGHVLGLAHNWAVQDFYPTDSLRRRTFLERIGFSSTVMNYVFLNNVAQPEDHIPAQDLFLHVGPYDRWAIACLYRPILDAYSLEAERDTVLRWTSAQKTAPDLYGEASNAYKTNRLGADPVIAADDRVHLLAHLVSRFPSSHGRWPKQLWGEWLQEAGVVGDYSGGDSAHVVPLVRFYLAHLVLDRDPLWHAAKVTWSAVPAGWSLEQWRTQQTEMLDDLLRGVAVLFASDQTSLATRAGVCSVFADAVRELTAMPADVREPVVRMHADSMRTRLDTLRVRGACTTPVRELGTRLSPPPH